MTGPGIFDLAIVGGGINGTGIARDAAGRGLSVLLCEKGDLGEGTSSRSGKLIHGGLRYLEYCEFRLVREALIEREVLLAAAPHIIWPLRFVLPHHKGLRPGPGCCAPGSSSTTISAAAENCRARAASTTFRRLSEQALERLRPFFPQMRPAWTADAALPGGDMPEGDFEAFLPAFGGRHPWLPAPLARHYARLYGTRAERILRGAMSIADLGRHPGEGKAAPA